MQAYAASGADGIITAAERRILVATADALNISSERASEIEQMFGLKVSEEEQQPATEPKVLQQWTDKAGHTWKRMDDGTTFWWNGTTWQQV